MFEEARPFLLALAIGLLIGIERERAKADAPYHAPLGSRTFTLVALLGAVAASVVPPAIAVVLAVFVGGAILAGYLRTRLEVDRADIGLTTEVAAMGTFVLGYLAVDRPRLSVMLAVLMLALLALKPRIHHFARAGLSGAEVRAAITFLVIAFVVLPLLPDRTVDPWKLINPARVWLMFALIAGISFGGYIAVRLLGARRGLAVAGLFAGFVSSTAATLSLSRRAHESEGLAGSLATGVVLANAASAAAQLVIVATINPRLTRPAAPVILAPVVVGVLAAWFAMLVLRKAPAVEGLALGNPLELRPAAVFAGAVALALAVVSAASSLFGDTGVLATSAIGGTGDVHAVTMAVSSLAAGGAVAPRLAVLAMLLAFLSNMVVKLAIAGGVGGRRLLAAVAPPMLAMMVAAAVAFWLYGPGG